MFEGGAHVACGPIRKSLPMAPQHAAQRSRPRPVRRRQLARPINGGQLHSASSLVRKSERRTEELASARLELRQLARLERRAAERKSGEALALRAGQVMSVCDPREARVFAG